MVKCQEIVHYLQDLLGTQGYPDYGPNGPQIEGKVELKKVGFAVSADLKTLEMASHLKCCALIVHHGLFWKHQGAKPLIGAFGKRVQTCMKENMNLLAYHLPLDSHLEVGNAASLARAIGLIDLKPYAISQERPLGVWGKFPTPLSKEAFLTKAQEVLKHEVLISGERKTFSTLGIVTGAAGSEWSYAQKLGLDAHLSGEGREHDWHDSQEGGVSLILGGHYATEVFGPQALMKKIQQNFDLEVVWIENPTPL